MNVHLNEFLRRLHREGADTALLDSLVFKREVDDSMNIGPGTWRVSMLGSPNSTFENLESKRSEPWTITREAGSLVIDRIEEVTVRRRLVNSKALMIHLGKRHNPKRGDHW